MLPEYNTTAAELMKYEPKPQFNQTDESYTQESGTGPPEFFLFLLIIVFFYWAWFLSIIFRFLRPHFVQYINLCAHLKTQHSQLACLHLWQAVYRLISSLHTSLVSFEMAAFLHREPFSSQRGEQDATVPCIQKQWDLTNPTPLCFKDQCSCWLFQAQPSYTDVDYQIDPNYCSLSSSSRVTGLSHHAVPTIMWAAGIKPRMLCM